MIATRVPLPRPLDCTQAAKSRLFLSICAKVSVLPMQWNAGRSANSLQLFSKSSPMDWFSSQVTSAGMPAG